jgi:outer membrane protein assembly factor BamB
MTYSLTTRLRGAAVLGLVGLAAMACGDPDGTAIDEPSTTAASTSTPGPTMPDVPPSEMCPEGQVPILAAYSLDDGTFQWATCDTSRDMHVAIAADAEQVWVEVPYPPQTLRIDAATGTVLELSEQPNPAIPDGADRLRRSAPATAAVQVSGGQDDPLVGTDIATGERRWSAVGFPVYDDVWAADAEAVYVTSSDPSGAQPGMWLAAYVIDTGEERWRVENTDYSMPWHAASGLVFTMWYDLHVFDAEDGTERWRTSYGEPPGGFPRMFGAVTNDETVFVSFTSTGSGGD